MASRSARSGLIATRTNRSWRSAHRLLRDVPADGEAVLSRHAKESQAGTRPSKGIAPIDPSTDLLTYLKPHADNSPAEISSRTTASADAGRAIAGVANAGKGSTENPSRWDDVLPGAEPRLRNAWRVNVLDLGFRSVTAVTLAAILGLCGFVLAVLPREKRRTRETDAIEFAIVVLLTVMFSPLSFNYAYVWLIYPMTLALHLVMSEPPGAPGHRARVAWIITVFLIPALALPMPVLAQAYGNLFMPALLLLFGLGVMLRGGPRHPGRENGCGFVRGSACRASFPVHDGCQLISIRSDQPVMRLAESGIAFFPALAKNAATIQARHPARRNAADGQEADCGRDLSEVQVAARRTDGTRRPP